MYNANHNKALHSYLHCCSIILNNSDKHKYADCYPDLNHISSASNKALYLLKYPIIQNNIEEERSYS
jgi:hypothetical protein